MGRAVSRPLAQRSDRNPAAGRRGRSSDRVGLRMATVAQILTYEEWLKLPPVEDGTDEVVKGELRFMPPTRQPHAEILRRLMRSLDRQLDDARAVAYGSNLGLMISREPPRRSVVLG